MTRPKSHKVALTKARRQEAWQQLTAEQQAVLIQHIRYRQTSLMMDRQLSVAMANGFSKRTTITTPMIRPQKNNYTVRVAADSSINMS